MAEKYTIPRPNSPFSEGGGNPTRAWYNFLRNLDDLFTASDAGVQAEITELAYKLGSPDGTVANIPPQTNIRSVQGLQSVTVSGSNVLQLALSGDVFAANPTSYYGSDDTGVKGWHYVFDAFATTTLDLSEDSTTHIVSFDLAVLADTGVGAALVKITRDTYGRVEGTEAATAADLPVDDSGWSVLSGADTQAALDSADTALSLVTSGTYTPTVTAVANLGSVSATSCQYMRVGNTVVVSGSINGTPALAVNTITTARISLPVTSVLANANECAGSCSFTAASTVQDGYVSADTVNAEASLTWTSTLASSGIIYFHFTYRVI